MLSSPDISHRYPFALTLLGLQSALFFTVQRWALTLQDSVLDICFTHCPVCQKL